MPLIKDDNKMRGRNYREKADLFANQLVKNIYTSSKADNR